MKHILISIFMMASFYSADLFSQEQELIPGEVHIAFVNLPGTWSFTIKTNSVGTVWDHDHYITTDYPGGDNYYDQNCALCWHASALSWFYPPHEPVLSLGLYEIAVWEGPFKRAWFYLDYRTSHLPSASNYNLDLKLDYDVTNKTLDFVKPPLGSVSNGSYYAIWDLVQGIKHYTSGLEDYWDNALAIVANTDNHPLLLWGPYSASSTPVGTIVGNKIYRSAGHPPGQPGNFTAIETVGASVYQFIDESALVGTGYEANSYYVTCVVEGASKRLFETGPTNTFEVRLIDPKKRGNNKTLYIPIEFALHQNYPNPFNPSTVISYTLPVFSKATLKVFDALGREVALLVDEYKDAGLHLVNFDASSLPSGVYLYRIQMGSHVEARKLILQK